MTTSSKPLVTRFHLLLLGVLLAITGAAVYKIPADTGLPVHWGLDGHPDGVWPRNAALALFPVLALVFTGLFLAIGWLAPPEQIEPGRSVSEAALSGLLGLFCALQFSLILVGVGSDLDLPRIIAFALAVVLLVIGNALRLSRPNVLVGVRLPWTLRDPADWRATHSVTGVLYMLGAVGLAIVAWLWPDPVDLLLGMFGAILLPLLFGGIFTFMRLRTGAKS